MAQQTQKAAKGNRHYRTDRTNRKYNYRRCPESIRGPAGMGWRSRGLPAKAGKRTRATTRPRRGR